LPLLLAGCGGAWERHIQDTLPDPQPVGVAPNKSITVAKSQLVHQVMYEVGAVVPTDDEAVFLASFLEQNTPTRAGEVTVLVERPKAKADRAAKQRSAALARHLRGLGYKVGEFTPELAADGQVLRVAISRMVAVAPRCPDGAPEAYETFASNSQSNFGCADRANLAATVAQPRDLIVGAVPAAWAGPAATLGQGRYDTGTVLEPEDVE
jgi:pilus assembly protein CpaD